MLLNFDILQFMADTHLSQVKILSNFNLISMQYSQKSVYNFYLNASIHTQAHTPRHRRLYILYVCVR